MIDSITFEKLKKIINKLEKDNIKSDTPISFEFLISSCFPNIYENMKKEMTLQYIEGYKAGLNIDSTDLEKIINKYLEIGNNNAAIRNH